MKEREFTVMAGTQEERNQVISKIREIVSNEKFKLDAYYFCGFPSGTPNEKLLKACERYLETLDRSEEPDRGVTDEMLAELENTLARKSKAADNLVNNDADIQAVLDHRELLIQGQDPPQREAWEPPHASR